METNKWEVPSLQAIVNDPESPYLSVEIPDAVRAWAAGHTGGVRSEETRLLTLVDPWEQTVPVAETLEQRICAWALRYKVLSDHGVVVSDRELVERELMELADAQRISHGESVKGYTQARNNFDFAREALITVGTTISAYAVEHDLCSQYESACDDMISTLNTRASRAENTPGAWSIVSWLEDAVRREVEQTYTVTGTIPFAVSVTVTVPYGGEVDSDVLDDEVESALEANGYPTDGYEIGDYYQD